MSFPVAIADRRILARGKCMRPCIVEFGPGDSVTASMHQLDPLGARIRLLEPRAEATGAIRIVTDDGVELYGVTSWRIGDVIGVKREPRSVARIRAFEAPKAA